jgi:hypothetical protein
MSSRPTLKVGLYPNSKREEHDVDEEHESFQEIRDRRDLRVLRGCSSEYVEADLEVRLTATEG